MTSDVWHLIGAAVAGAVLGGCFFVGLWWTVRVAPQSAHPALWFAASLALRITIVGCGFHFLFGSQPAMLLAALFGFMITRLFAVRIARRSAAKTLAVPYAP